MFVAFLKLCSLTCPRKHQHGSCFHKLSKQFERPQLSDEQHCSLLDTCQMEVKFGQKLCTSQILRDSLTPSLKKERKLRDFILRRNRCMKVPKRGRNASMAKILWNHNTDPMMWNLWRFMGYRANKLHMRVRWAYFAMQMKTVKKQHY